MLLSEVQKACAEEAIQCLNQTLLLQYTSYDPSSIVYNNELEELLHYFQAVIEHYKKIKRQ